MRDGNKAADVAVLVNDKAAEPAVSSSPATAAGSVAVADTAVEAKQSGAVAADAAVEPMDPAVLGQWEKALPPFILKRVNRTAQLCSECGWLQMCRGTANTTPFLSDREKLSCVLVSLLHCQAT